MIIAVDFDGTIVEHRYPRIGKEIPFAIETLKRLQTDHHQLILWTVREGSLLSDAVEYCRSHGVIFSAVNNNLISIAKEKNSYSDGQCRKIAVDIFIDDRNVGGLLDWGLIYKMITEQLNYNELFDFTHDTVVNKDIGIWTKLMQLFKIRY